MSMKLAPRTLVLLPFLVLVGATPNAWAALTVSILSVPSTPTGTFTATISGGSSQDPTPNPCYGRPLESCNLRFFTIDESWYPDAIVRGYQTYDTHSSWISTFDVTTYRTIGEWWRDVQNKGRSGTDNLPANFLHEGPCTVVAAALGRAAVPPILPGSVVSNCARGLVQATTCRVEPDLIEIEASVPEGSDVPDIAVNGVYVGCDAAADVRIETGTQERIPLGGITPPMQC
ncbi:hypothetical protein BA187_17670 [Serratia marcescens]|nr:hypothetical protein BA187_17670 [Serratia marcescens]